MYWMSRLILALNSLKIMAKVPLIQSCTSFIRQLNRRIYILNAGHSFIYRRKSENRSVFLLWIIQSSLSKNEALIYTFSKKTNLKLKYLKTWMNQLILNRSVNIKFTNWSVWTVFNANRPLINWIQLRFFGNSLTVGVAGFYMVVFTVRAGQIVSHRSTGQNVAKLLGNNFGRIYSHQSEKTVFIVWLKCLKQNDTQYAQVCGRSDVDQGFYMWKLRNWIQELAWVYFLHFHWIDCDSEAWNRLSSRKSQLFPQKISFCKVPTNIWAIIANHLFILRNQLSADPSIY